MLIAFSGLPGTGKTTLARGLAKRLGATYLRIDTIEDELIAHDGAELVERGAGYGVAYGVAEDNLALGRTVVADSVNPSGITRETWRRLANRAGVAAIDVLVTCSDVIKHQERINARPPGTRGASWAAIQGRVFEAANERTLLIDTSTQTVDQCLATLEEAIGIATR
jgi:predicted kinase